MKPENVKCGEIIRYAPGKYTFNCSRCSESFTTKSAALNHFESHFIVESTIKLNVIFETDQEESKVVVDYKDDIQNLVDDIKREDPLEVRSENTFLLEETLSGKYCKNVQTSVKTTFVSTFSNNVSDPAERCLSLKSYSKWGQLHTKKTLFECDICGKQMAKSKLKEHFLAHLDRKEFVCTICNRSFNNINQLKRHELTHSTTKRFSCEHCGWRFHDRANLRVHIRRHTGEKPYKCQICDKSFAISSTLKAHTRTHTGDKPYKCKLCDQSFTYRNTFRMHVNRHNKYHGPLQCKLCENKSFETWIDLKNHIQSLHTNEEFCHNEQTSVEMALSNIASNSVEDRLNLKPQLKWGPSHTSKTLFECDICGKQMVRSNLKKHFLAHLNQKEFVCTVCNRRFNNKSQLRRHSLTHSITKRFNCDHCGWQFHDRTNLLVHIRKHTGEKPYKCQICDKSFSQASSLKAHIRRHTGDKPYKCQLCSQAYASSSELRMHVNRHNNYHGPHQCQLCENKSFQSTTDLKNHIRSMHTGERPYVCEVCNSSYSRKGQYNQHILLHTGEKKYKCRVCDIYFNQRASRRIHEKSIHKEVAHLLINT